MPPLPTFPDAAVAFYQRGQQVTAAALVALRDRWRRFDGGAIDASFTRLVPDLVTVLAVTQLAAARSATAYLPAVLDEQGVDAPAVATVETAAFVGASSGVPLEQMLSVVPIRAKQQAARGATRQQISDTTLSLVEGMYRTQIADSARTATSVGMIVRPKVKGYVRMLNPPSCARCVILAGARYSSMTAFLRHPRCDCRHIPVAEGTDNATTTDPAAYFRSLPAAEQDVAFTGSGAAAIRAGADIGQVVNVRRTAAGLTTAGGRRRPGARLTPDAIMAEATSRDDAIRLLQQHRYIT